MDQIQYSEKYFDDIYEYRHVVLPTEVAKLLPKNRLLSEHRGWNLRPLWDPPPRATQCALQEALEPPAASSQQQP